MMIDLTAFPIFVEVVPPGQADPKDLLTSLREIQSLPIDGFNVATNPVGKPRMSALALCALLQRELPQPAVLHCTTRDHNRISLQSLFWGAKALEINTVLVTTGDRLSNDGRHSPSFVGDVSVFELISMARKSDLQVGVVFEPPAREKDYPQALARLQEKISQGAQFIITQPIYQKEAARELSEKLKPAGIPTLMGVLPLYSQKHARFMDQNVSGIQVPEEIISRLGSSEDPPALGLRQASEMIAVGREEFQGLCIMPPFQKYELVWELF